MRRFKSWPKGFYDQYGDEAAIWVTGSGRLNLYQKGGDSLLGRYFLYRMHPLSLGELQSIQKEAALMDPVGGWNIFLSGDFKLWYVRDREKREVDALITRDDTPWLLVEVKMNGTNVSKSLQRFAGILKCRNIVQVVKPDDICRQVKIDSKIFNVVSAGIFLSWLP